MARLTPGRLLMNTSPRAWSNGVAWSPADEYGVGVRGVGVRGVGVRGVGVRGVGVRRVQNVRSQVKSKM